MPRVTMLRRDWPGVCSSPWPIARSACSIAVGRVDPRSLCTHSSSRPSGAIPRKAFFVSGVDAGMFRSHSTRVVSLTTDVTERMWGTGLPARLPGPRYGFESRHSLQEVRGHGRRARRRVVSAGIRVRVPLSSPSAEGRDGDLGGPMSLGMRVRFPPPRPSAGSTSELVWS